MGLLRQLFTQDVVLRLHFLASPFGVAVVTYGITLWRLGRLPDIADFDALTAYAGAGVILYGMGAVVVDLGGQTVFYTIAAIIKFIDERKAEREANAVRVVSENDDLLDRIIRENLPLAEQIVRERQTLAEQVIRDNLPLAEQIVRERQERTEQAIRENPALAAEILERIERESSGPGE